MISFERPLGVPPSETCLDGIRIKSTRLDSGYRHSEFRAGSSTGLDICALAALAFPWFCTRAACPPHRAKPALRKTALAKTMLKVSARFLNFLIQ